MRWAILACVVLATACGGSTFTDAKEELSYLESLSNPSPEQWKRREELREASRKALVDDIERRGRADAEKRQTERDAESDREKERIAVADRQNRLDMIDLARRWEKAGDTDKAIEYFNKVATLYPTTPEGKTAKGERDRLRAAK